MPWCACSLNSQKLQPDRSRREKGPPLATPLQSMQVGGGKGEAWADNRGHCVSKHMFLNSKAWMSEVRLVRSEQNRERLLFCWIMSVDEWRGQHHPRKGRETRTEHSVLYSHFKRTPCLWQALHAWISGKGNQLWAAQCIRHFLWVF